MHTIITSGHSSHVSRDYFGHDGGHFFIIFLGIGERHLPIKIGISQICQKTSVTYEKEKIKEK